MKKKMKKRKKKTKRCCKAVVLADFVLLPLKFSAGCSSVTFGESYLFIMFISCGKDPSGFTAARDFFS